MSEPMELDEPRYSDPHNVVIVENLGIRYQTPTVFTRSLKEFMIRAAKGQVQMKHFWALRNINLTVKKGEILGLIGHNGAGKSTLLKSIARILKPTEGRLMVRGAVAPLMSVGAGFHPELTGRENVFLNGTLLGFSRKEMEEKFEGIVDFAELWDFIDQPLRTYSTGMRARLGFAVATDTRPDILIVDEILSVGDEAFRIKSSERMKSFQDNGATILLVSHSMDTITNICHRVSWIHQGRQHMTGPAKEVVEAYVAERMEHLKKQ